MKKLRQMAIEKKMLLPACRPFPAYILALKEAKGNLSVRFQNCGCHPLEGHEGVMQKKWHASK